MQMSLADWSSLGLLVSAGFTTILVGWSIVTAVEALRSNARRRDRR
jgi:hypothetical protein